MNRLLVSAGCAALILSLAAALSSCADGELGQTAGPPFRFNITALPAAYQPWFAEAAAEWNAATGRELFIIDSHGPNRALIDTTPGASVDSVARDDNGITIRFAEPLDVLHNCFLPVALHALGHAAESYWPDNPADPFHSPLPSDVMFALLICGKTLTQRDIHTIRD